MMMPAKQFNEAATSDLKIPLFPLERSLFPVWKKRMMTYLRGKGLLDAVLEKPTYIIHEKKVSEEEYREWVKGCRDRCDTAEVMMTTLKGNELMGNEFVKFRVELMRHTQVVAILHQSFRQTQLDLVDDVFPDNAFKMWKTITSQYEIIQSGDTIQAVLTQLHGII